MSLLEIRNLTVEFGPADRPFAAVQGVDLSAERGELLDWLVRRAVLAKPDGVVCEHVDRLLLHERGKPDRRPHVV